MMSALLYLRGVTAEQARAWIAGIVPALAYGVYVVVVLGRTGAGPITATPYVVPLLWTVGVSIVATIVGNIVAGLLIPAEDAQVDVRDREIGRLGERVGGAFVVIGGVAALLLAMAEAPHFWIANAVYLAFVLSAVLGAIARLAAYRWGF
jgi:hypothetical protein